MLSKDENLFQPFFKWIIHDVFQDFLACSIKHGGVFVDNAFEIIDFFKEEGKHILDILLESIEFIVVEVHDLEVGQDLQYLLIEVTS
jgi:hypothetical protein